jgi:hypothetical protein
MKATQAERPLLSPSALAAGCHSESCLLSFCCPTERASIADAHKVVQYDISDNCSSRPNITTGLQRGTSAYVLSPLKPKESCFAAFFQQEAGPASASQMNDSDANSMAGCMHNMQQDQRQCQTAGPSQDGHLSTIELRAAVNSRCSALCAIL